MSVRIDGVTFSYGDKEVLRDIRISVKTGESIGIVGTSGGGKSTLLKLLSGLYAPQAGDIYINGARSQEDIRANTALVMQNPTLFPMSIRENITCGHPMSDEVIKNACEAAQLTGWISTLSEGLDTFVGERGGKVSGGQAQRISIARAIAKATPVVLLDEATSALDGDTGRAVLRALDNLMRGKTVISVSHQPEMLVGCDRVYRLDGGQLYDI